MNKSLTSIVTITIASLLVGVAGYEGFVSRPGFDVLIAYGSVVMLGLIALLDYRISIRSLTK